MAGYSEQIKSEAKLLFTVGQLTPKEIQGKLNLGSVRVVYQWMEKYNWADGMSHATLEEKLKRRAAVLIDRENKTSSELNELDRIFDLLIKKAKLEKIKVETANTGKAANDQGPRRSNKSRGKQRKKNDCTALTEADFKREFYGKLYAYQQNWWDNKHERMRFILKSRQIGATYYFAGEAFAAAVLEGRNQNFISASKRQSEIFKRYIMAFAKEWFGIELSGNPMVLQTQHGDVTLNFLSTNAATSQGESGDTYFDEVFWTPGFEKLESVASGMAMHKKWRLTYFSTPSTKQHPAYPMWSGESHNKNLKARRKKAAVFDLGHALLKHGHKGPDRVWRNMVTVMDAKEGGCDLFDIEELELKYSPAQFKNLLMCEFMDHTASVFGMDLLEKCYGDMDAWADYKPLNKRPFGNREVWLGVDPSRTTDASSVVVIAPPQKPGDKFRLLERLEFHGKNFAWQAGKIEQLTKKYRVGYIGVDLTGIGYGLFEKIKEFYTGVTPIHYSVETKNKLVLKAIDVINNGRLEFDAGDIDVAAAFMTIRQVTTKGGTTTYSADRTADTGHADVAWSIMHALHNEPLRKRKSSSYS
jgi:uncharacterized protein YjcR